MPLTFTPSQKIYIEELKNNFASNLMNYCEKEVYIRTEIDDAAVKEKQEALKFTDEEGNVTVTILEDVVFYEKEDKLYLINGNTRVRALFLLLATNPEYDYSPIPFKVIEEGWTPEDLDSLQVATNDKTSPHKPIDLVLRIGAKRKYYLESFAAAGIKAKEAKGKATQLLTNTYKCSAAYISQMETVFDQPEWVHKLIREDKIAPNTVVSVHRVAKKNTDVKLENIYGLLFDISNDEKITDKHVDILVDSLSNKTKAIGEGTEESTEESTGESTGGETVTKGEGSSLPAIPISKEVFVSNHSAILNKLTVVDPSKVTILQKDITREFVSQGLKLVNDTNLIFSDADSLALLEPLLQILQSRFGDSDYLIQRAETADKPLNEINARINRISKSLTGLIESLNEPIAEEVVAQAVEQDAADAAKLEANPV
jgi:hypothetical protein